MAVVTVALMMSVSDGLTYSLRKRASDLISSKKHIAQFAPCQDQTREVPLPMVHSPSVAHSLGRLFVPSSVISSPPPSSRSYTQYFIPTQEAGDAPVTPLRLRMSMDGATGGGRALSYGPSYCPPTSFTDIVNLCEFSGELPPYFISLRGLSPDGWIEVLWAGVA
ncbi:hypothetical protein EVAR_55143_1 [Eumeta japonica]|uniref:Uncharacterized protein n=1 Tax=Eumeta variegata TaxID=151549 RepID=A0A4C1YAP3_EUMVA|nr:hypothetical protein EVAR_55143_1 [Eumeta japonica]